jgi:colanic acid biosynthesis glycosyl transferase WcaI
MHIAFFNRSYYPDQTATGQLLTDLSEDLVGEHGCSVSVVVGPPLQPLPGQVVEQRGIAARETRNGVEIHRARGTRFDKRRFAGRATNYVTYFMSATWAGLRLNRPDVLVALTDPPIIGLTAWLAGKRFRAPFVMAFNDLFPEVAALLPDFRSSTVDNVLQRVNEFLVRRAAMNIALGETMRQRLIDNKGAAADRTTVIPSWTDTSAIVPGNKDNAFARAHGLADKFVVMHSGNLGLSQELESVVEAASLLRDLPDLVVVFQGDGVMRSALEAKVQSAGLTNVRFLPFASRADLSASFASADAFVVSLQRGLAGFIVPSKLYGILAAGRPYVAAVEENCEVDVITRRHDCGVLAEPGNAQSVARAIRALYDDRDRTARLGANARAASTLFDRRLQVRRYLDVFQSVLSAPRTASNASVGEPERTDRGVGVPVLRPARGALSEVERTGAKPPGSAL